MNNKTARTGPELVAEALRASGVDVDSAVATPSDIDEALKAAGVPPLHASKDASISYDDFAKVDLCFGTILNAVPVPKSDKLLQLTVDLGEATPRTILAGIGKTFSNPALLIGQQRLFVTNLAPRKMMGIESHGMLLACGEGPDKLSLASPTGNVPPGSKVH